MKKLAIIFVTMILLVSFAAADITVQDYTFTIARGNNDTQTRSVTNNINENVTIDFSSTTLSTITDSFSGVTLTPTTLNITGVTSENLLVSINVPTSTKPGTYNGTIQYSSNNGSQVSTGTSNIIVSVTNEAPVITLIADANIIVGNSFSYQVIANDTESDTLSYTLTQAPAGMGISVTGLISGWSATSAGTTAITVEVTDGYANTTESFNIIAKNNLPDATLSASELTFGDVNGARGTTIIKTITVENTGVQPLTNLAATLQATNGGALFAIYNGNTVLSKTSLAVGEVAVITISIDIPTTQDSEKTTIGRLVFTAAGTSSNIQKSTNLIMKAKSFLRIKNVEFKIDGDSDNIDPGDNYRKIKEGDNVRVTVTLENLYPNSANIEIQNAYFQIEADDNDWDIDEESRDVDIRESDDEDISLTFTLNDDINSDQTDVTIRAYGDDENENYEHYDEITFSLEIDRERDEVRITSVNFDKSTYSCSDSYAQVDVKIKNTGTDDQDEVTLQLIADELNWHKRITNIDLRDGDSETKSFKVDLTGFNKADDYFLEIQAFVNNNDETDSQAEVITVSCFDSNTNTNADTTTTRPTVPSNAYRPSTTSSDNTVVVVANEPTTTDSNVVYGEPIGSLNDFTSSNLYLVLLVAIIVFIIAGIFLLGRTIIKK